MLALRRKLVSFAKLSGAVKLLFLEALVTSLYVKVVLLFFPFRRVAAWLGSHQQREVSLQDESVINRDIILKVRTAIMLCDKYAFWPTECYTRSLTGKLMLKRRGVLSTLYFGFCRNGERKLEGHAWLKVNDMVVTGFADFTKYQIHSSYL